MFNDEDDARGDDDSRGSDDDDDDDEDDDDDDAVQNADNSMLLKPKAEPSVACIVLSINPRSNAKMFAGNELPAVWWRLRLLGPWSLIGVLNPLVGAVLF